MIYPVYIHTAFDESPVNFFFFWTAQQGVAMPEGTKGWTEMKTGDSEGAGQKPLSGQEPRLLEGLGGWEGRPGRFLGCPRM